MSEKINFEKSVAELEEIVQKLEKGDADLEETLKLFERGISLSSKCAKVLDEAEQRVSVLLADKEGNISEEDFLKDKDNDC